MHVFVVSRSLSSDSVNYVTVNNHFVQFDGDDVCRVLFVEVCEIKWLSCFCLGFKKDVRIVTTEYIVSHENFNMKYIQRNQEDSYLILFYIFLKEWKIIKNIYNTLNFLIKLNNNNVYLRY